jgi:hypothetical protein
MDGIYSDKSICLWKINKLPDLNLVWEYYIYIRANLN